MQGHDFISVAEFPLILSAKFGLFQALKRSQVLKAFIWF